MADEKQEAENQAHDAREDKAEHAKGVADAAQDEANAEQRKAAVDAGEV